ncbi:MAG: tRNA preQ1(34) S-adenosylmethionine ribosyltransferase-isomerase QueA [Pseudomonadota bacterium]
MDVDLFDFELPEERIALRPAEPREAARLLCVPVHVPGGCGAFDDRRIEDLPDLLTPGDVLVVNDTRVIAGALEGTRQRGDATARITANLLHRVDGRTWAVLLRPAKKVAIGETIAFSRTGEADAAVEAQVIEKSDGGLVTLMFEDDGDALDRAMERIGHMPLPPYIARKRPQDSHDRDDYQTMFARERGAVAAPTAGLHFTPELLDALAARGITRETVTLHVGGGTFLPVKAADTDAHVMHAEWGHIETGVADRLNRARREGRRIVAIGTTSLRLLESAVGADGLMHAFRGETDIFMTPGYAFKAVDVLLTNFHLPRSTLFMLVAAFSGLARMKQAYAHAIASDYRFYSYGDACLLECAASAQTAMRPTA